ncbi:septum site-determining protein Ssd [Streptomyces alkaliterrae]|uniref:Septum formation initiator n=1 Tax=Streptomyces alkaliterrae TaxID=2213162 RepID=A0A5P0YMS8_9ACTN|nr:septum site-determining protein Ssd [Streptomyces alkaliterrae]MBB1259915.1 septum formation initiator [Streptomyces alkaliterrae]MQS01548.1 septum formation initiator [Streptomyces alkaliterrae]
MAESILIVTEDPELLDDLLRLCAAAGAEAEVSHGPGESGDPPGERAWRSAGLVLVGADRAAALGEGAPPVPRRPGVLLVSRDLDDHRVWERAVRLGAEHVVFLPDGEGWLTGRIADAAEGVGRAALTVGVVGGRGGAGASTLACALALTAARRGVRSMLIDGDPLGGGLDVLLGGESAEGLRWPAFAESRGRVGARALEEALPAMHELRVLSWDRGDSLAVPPEAMRTVLGAARRRGGVVVVDLPRQLDEAVAEALVQLDIGLLVVPAELRAVAAARRVCSRLAMLLPDIRVVVRGPFTAGINADDTARLVGLPLVGELPPERRLAEAVDRGVPPGGAMDGPLARFCSGFWRQALSDDGRPGSVAA